MQVTRRQALGLSAGAMAFVALGPGLKAARADEAATQKMLMDFTGGKEPASGKITLTAPEIAENGPYDLVFANILKGPLIQLATPMAQHTAPGGYVILSGLLNEQADEVTAAYVDAGFTPAHHDIIGEWSTLTLLKAA